jgi:hypothetical protein
VTWKGGTDGAVFAIALEGFSAKAADWATERTKARREALRELATLGSTEVSDRRLIIPKNS